MTQFEKQFGHSMRRMQRMRNLAHEYMDLAHEAVLETDLHLAVLADHMLTPLEAVHAAYALDEVRRLDTPPADVVD